jgi:hypothetical protein
MASFNGKPGVEVKEVPSEMRGTYIHIDKEKGVSDTITLLVGATSAEIDDPMVGKLLIEGDSTRTLSHLGDFYYFNVCEEDSNGRVTYIVYPFEFARNTLFVYKLQLTKKSMKRMNRSGLKQTGRRIGEYYMDKEPFRKYCERNLKRKDALKFKKVK